MDLIQEPPHPTVVPSAPPGEMKLNLNLIQRLLHTPNVPQSASDEQTRDWLSFDKAISTKCEPK